MTSKKRAPSGLLTAGDVATMLGVSVVSLSRWRREGRELGFRVIGSQYFYDRAEVANYLERSYRPPGGGEK